VGVRSSKLGYPVRDERAVVCRDFDGLSPVGRPDGRRSFDRLRMSGMH
jgi:hypothetical protein